MLTKKFKHGRLKKQAHKEPKYMEWIHEVEQPPCFVCGTMLGIEVHHVKEYSTDKRNDDVVLPLCHEHHHGSGLSPHGTPKDFRDIYPMEYQRRKALELYIKYKEEDYGRK